MFDIKQIDISIVPCMCKGGESTYSNTITKKKVNTISYIKAYNLS